MASGYDVTIRDYGKEVSTAGFRGVTLDAANMVAQAALMATLLTAVGNITIGQVAKTKVVANSTLVSQAAASDPNAQRERKWLVRYEDQTTHGLYNVEIPTADLSGTHLQAGQDTADLTDADMAAFVSAFEAFQRSPDGNAVTVIEILHVGRTI